MKLLVPSHYDPTIDKELQAHRHYLLEQWKDCPFSFKAVANMLEVGDIWENKGEHFHANVQVILELEERPGGIVLTEGRRFMRTVGIPAKINTTFYLARQGSKKFKTKKLWAYKEAAKTLLQAFPAIIREFRRQGYEPVGLRTAREAIAQSRGNASSSDEAG